MLQNFSLGKQIIAPLGFPWIFTVPNQEQLNFRWYRNGTDHPLFYCTVTRRKFTSKFKTKVVLEALKERQTVKELAHKYEVSPQPQQINNWKRDFLKDADTVFSKGGKSKKSEAEEREECLLKVIGEQKENWIF